MMKEEKRKVLEKKKRKSRGETYTFWDKSPGNLTPALWNDPAQMGCTSWGINSQPLFNYGVQIHAVQQALAIDSLDARKLATQLIL